MMMKNYIHIIIYINTFLNLGNDIMTSNKIIIHIIDYDNVSYILNLLNKNIYNQVNNINFYNFNRYIDNYQILKNIEILRIIYKDNNDKDNKKLKLSCEKVNTLEINDISYLNNNISFHFPNLKSLYFCAYNEMDIDLILKKIPDGLVSFTLYINNYNKINYNIDMNILNKMQSINIHYTNYKYTMSDNVFILCDFTNLTNNTTIKEISILNCNIKSLNNINNILNIRNLYLNNINIESNYNLNIYSNTLKNISIIIIYNIKYNYLKSLKIISSSLVKARFYNILNNEPILLTNNLINLELCDNNISELSTKFFLNLPNIEYLKIENCGLKKLNSSISMCKKLKKLDLNNNELTIMPDYLKTVNELTLNNNPLITLDNVVFKNLELCNICNTNIKKLILSKSNKLLNLKKIDYNNIEYIDDRLRKYVVDNA